MTISRSPEPDPPGQHDAVNASFDEIRGGIRTGEHLTIEDLKDVRLSITADLGKCRMSIREILDLKRGSVIQLDKLAGEMSDVCVNGIPLARGEVIVIADALNIRIGEIIGAESKGNELEQT